MKSVGAIENLSRNDHMARYFTKCNILTLEQLFTLAIYKGIPRSHIWLNIVSQCTPTTGPYTFGQASLRIAVMHKRRWSADELLNSQRMNSLIPKLLDNHYALLN